MTADGPYISHTLNDGGELELTMYNAPEGALIRYAYPWEGKRVLFMNGPCLAPIPPLPGREVRFRIFSGRKGISDMQSYTFAGQPDEAPLSTALVPCTQNRDFMAYAWEERHRSVLETVARRNPRLLFIGDSITHFFGGDPVDPVLMEYQRMAPDIWDAQFGSWNPANLGFGNDRIENALWRIQHGELDGATPDALCVILIGTNNMRVNTDAEIVEGIANLCREIHARLPQGNILLQGIYPRTTRVERVPVINAMLSRLELPNTFFCSPGNAIAGENYLPLEGSTHDGVHPTRHGYIKIAGVLRREISRLME